MYEMEGPRPVLRHRPADCSARSRRSTTYQGQERSPGLWSRPDHRVARGFPRRGRRIPLCQQARGFPHAGWRRVLPQPVAQSFLLPIDRGFPQAKGLKFPLRRVAQSFPLITQLGVSPPPHNLKFSLRRRPRAFFAARDSGFPPPPQLRSFPCAGGPRFPLAGSPLAGVAPGFPQGQRPQSLPNTGWPGVSPAPWLGVSSLPVAPDFSLPESPELPFAGGSGFPLRRLPSLVVGKFLRLSPGLHKRFWAAISRFFRRPQAIHS
jgi:hypothetical protein